ncbi:MAG TPA: hypothetical protein VGN01_19230 [Acidobacteriaceae bacterium]|jgi:hypothetical protein
MFSADVDRTKVICDLQKFFSYKLRSGWLVSFLIFSFLSFGDDYLSSQCPNSGETKVLQPKQGTGYNFFEFRGDSSFRYFLDGKTFSLNTKDDPGKTFVFIDKMIYEPLLIEATQLKEYTQSSKPIDILHAQAKHEQEYFKTANPPMQITDYGPASRKNSDGSDGRLFYLWKKEGGSGKQPVTQYLVSTLIKDGVFVMSFMTTDDSLSQDDMLRQIQSYTSHFDLLSNQQCAQVLAAPSAP